MFGLPSLAIYGIAALALLVSGFGGGWKVASDHAKAHELAAVQQAEESRRLVEMQLGMVSTALEQEKARQHVVYRTVTKAVDRVVDRPVYRNVCLDADGLRLANSALAGQAIDPGQPDGAVPPARPSDGGNGRGGAAQAR